MPEEQEKQKEQEEQKKPKATLIKHRNTQSLPSTEEKSRNDETKKVVVIKKKVVVVKKGLPKTGKKAPELQKEILKLKKAIAQQKKTGEKKPSLVRMKGRAPDRFRPAPPSDRSGSERTAPPRKFTSSPRDFSGKSGIPVISDSRRPGFKPLQGKSTQQRPADIKKSPGKKFFKTKRKSTYLRKSKQEYHEKLIPVKKKEIHRANPIPKEISIMEVITVSDLARKMNLKASELISKLMGMGMMATINQQIDAETATILADEYSCKVNIVSLYDETVIETEQDREEEMQARPPIITVMGHVDHGKTKFLDAIRSTNVVDTEFGGITQHIGAYVVELPQGKLVFLDTPGHEAFTTMRARGAQVTDIVVLVVAANDGVMPQTVEAVNHAKAAGVPIIVAINKIDLPEANSERIKQQLSEYDLVPEEWGGHTIYCEISALQKTGIDNLLENILIQSEMLELNANYNCRAEGHIIESKIDLGRGIVSTVLVQRGTLHVGDSYVAGIFPGKVRAMFNDMGDRIEESTPSMPVEILGFSGIPNAGDPFQVTDSEKSARQIGIKRQELKKREQSKNLKKITLDNLYEQIKEGELKELNVIIKGDVHGSVEALQNSLEKLSTSEIKLVTRHASAGTINENDVMLASASNAIIIGFNVRPNSSTQNLADQEKVEIRKYNIIYEAIEDIKSAMEGLLSPELKEQTLGVAEVRNIFRVPKIGTIAGCYITSGKIRRGAEVQLFRDGVGIYRGKISSLKRFKDDAREVETGFECGIGIENFNDIKVGDLIEAYEIIELTKKLEGGDGRDQAKES
ncbi:MAG TPA: translation initiation factor IF-2 [Spirochaetales bacterium]|nr:translation initiation factor IF-2 [Spirochaetales bacterium]